MERAFSARGAKAVAISTPHAYHFQQIVDALGAGTATVTARVSGGGETDGVEQTWTPRGTTAELPEMRYATAL